MRCVEINGEMTFAWSASESEDDDCDDDEADDGDEGDPESEAHRAEVDEAFRLFAGAGVGASDSSSADDTATATLTLAHLKRVAMTLKQDVDEALLRDMILEANGGAGVGRGVSRAEFDQVMRRAGAWK